MHVGGLSRDIVVATDGQRRRARLYMEKMTFCFVGVSPWKVPRIVRNSILSWLYQ